MLHALSILAFSVTLFVRAGGAGWCDVVFLPEGPALVRSNDAAVLVETPVRLYWATGLPEPILYLQATYCRGEVRAVGQGHGTGQALEIRESGVRAFGPSFGQNATTIACVNERFLAYTQFSPTQIAVSDLDTMSTEIVTVLHTSQGIRDVTARGDIRRGDDWFRIPNQYGLGRSIHQPVEREGAYAGQNSDGLGILELLVDRAFTTVPGIAFEPALERRGDVFAIAARTPAGAALAIVTPPYPPHEPPPTTAVEICGNKIDDDGDGLTDEPPCPIDPPPPQLPACAAGGNGIENGVVVDLCQWFFNPLVQGQPASRWETILNAIEPSLWAKGFGQQRDNSGRVRARFFLPTRICPNAAPPPDDERAKFLGVRQDERCWDQLGRIADPVSADGTQWIWNERGAQPYQPFTGGVVIDPPPPTDLDKRVAALEQSLTATRAELTLTQAALNGLQSKVLDDIGPRVVALEQKPDGGALTPEQRTLLESVRQFLDLLKNGFSTGRSLGHSHGFRWEPPPIKESAR